MLTARFLYPENGREYNIEQAKKHLKVGESYVVENVVMSQSCTDIFLAGFEKPFNSVQFEFFKNGFPHDIFRDPEYNPYLGGVHRVI